jgi:hypothetical protein
MAASVALCGDTRLDKKNSLMLERFSSTLSQIMQRRVRMRGSLVRLKLNGLRFARSLVLVLINRLPSYLCSTTHALSRTIPNDTRHIHSLRINWVPRRRTRLTAVKLVERSNILRCELKVVQTRVRVDPGGRCRLWQRDEALLEMPTQENLCTVATILEDMRQLR